jgi:hypothetical protein
MASMQGRRVVSIHPQEPFMQVIEPSRLLRTAIVIDACASAGSGALQLVATPAMAALCGLPVALLLASGVFVLGYAALLLWMARAAALPRALVRLVIVGNLGWAAGCVALALLLPDLTALGTGYLLLQAAAVALFALLQQAGLARATPAAQLQAQRA